MKSSHALIALLAFYILLGTGCASRQNYGERMATGTALDCGEFRVTVFNEHLKSSPNIFGPNTFVAYEDFGPGLSRGTVFLVLSKAEYERKENGIPLSDFDPKERDFWKEARLIEGSYEEEDIFIVVIPEKSRSPMPSAKIVDREELFVCGMLTEKNGMHFLLMAQRNPLYNGSDATEMVREDFNEFTSNIEWRANKAVVSTPLRAPRSTP